MRIASVDIDPVREVYTPGDVLNVAVNFEEPFVGQLEAGLSKRAAGGGGPERAAVFARSSDYLYEGQVHVRLGDIGDCMLLGRLTPVRGAPVVVPLGDRILYVRPIRP